VLEATLDPGDLARCESESEEREDDRETAAVELRPYGFMERRLCCYGPFLTL
jgi:hypothetical protein